MLRSSLFSRLFKQNKPDKQKVTYDAKITKSLDKNLQNLRQMLGEPGDLVVRELMIGGLETRAAIVYISGIVDENLINNNILKAIQHNLKQFEKAVLENIYKEVIAVTEVKKANTMDPWIKFPSNY